MGGDAGRIPTMNAGARQNYLAAGEQGTKKARSNGERAMKMESEARVEARTAERTGHACRETRTGGKPRVFVAAENRLLREALSRMLVKGGDIEVAGIFMAEPFRAEELIKEEADILLLTSRGSMNEDLTAIRKVRACAPNVQILLIGMAGEETEFMQCVRAGVHGYLPKEASAEEVVEGVRAVQAGEAVCPGTLCALLFRYFEREATSFPSASVRQRMGLTRREQQLVPLIAEGLTNKEIANRFCLSEQTVKNHLYRMKHKVGAEDRLSIVQVCRTQGFMV
jgi:DNA-binding NarL/FixJ family response regulator